MEQKKFKRLIINKSNEFRFIEFGFIRSENNSIEMIVDFQTKRNLHRFVINQN